MKNIFFIKQHTTKVKKKPINYTVRILLLVIDVSGVMVGVLGVVDHGSLVKPMTINYTVLEFCSL